MAVNDIPHDHAAHDEILVVAYASGDAKGRDAEQAAALVVACADCARLAADIHELRTNVAALPAPRRTRDFRLTESDAARLRPAGWRRIAATLAGPRLAFAGPIGTAIAALGIAGLLVGTAPSLFSAGAAPSLFSAGSVSAPAVAAPGAAGVPGAAKVPGAESAAGGGASVGVSGQDTGVAANPAPASAAPSAAAAASAFPKIMAAPPSGPDTTVTSAPIGVGSAAGTAEPLTASSQGQPASSEAAGGARSAVAPSAGSGSAGPSAASAAAGSTGPVPLAGPTAPVPPAGPSPLVLASSAFVLAGLALVVGRLAARRLAP